MPDKFIKDHNIFISLNQPDTSNNVSYESVADTVWVDLTPASKTLTSLIEQYGSSIDFKKLSFLDFKYHEIRNALLILKKFDLLVILST